MRPDLLAAAEGRDGSAASHCKGVRGWWYDRQERGGNETREVCAYVVSGEIPVPALCPRPTEAGIHAKYVYKVALNIKTFKAFKYLLTLLSQDEELRCFSSLSFLFKKVFIFGKFKLPCKIPI